MLGVLLKWLLIYKVEIVMSRLLGALLLAVWVGFVAAPAQAQVEWVTPLGLPDSKSGFVSQYDCLMPRLGASSPVLAPRPPASSPGQSATTPWWGRTQDGDGRVDARWTKVDALSGAVVNRAPVPPSSVICGAPVTAEGGRMVVEEYGNRRLSQFDASGVLRWQSGDTSTPLSSSTPAVISVAANGDSTYAVGDRLRRVNASGGVMFDVATGVTGVKYLAVNASGDTWLVANDSGTAATVSRFSPSGNQLWSTTASAACIWETTAALLTATDELLFAGFACNEARVVRIAADGRLLWQRLVSGAEPRSRVRLSALSVDGAGNAYVAGCAEAGFLTYFSPNAWTVAASWSASGAERWSAAADVAGGISACSSALALSASGLLYIATAADITNSSDSPGVSALWVLDTAGVEKWRHRGALSSPAATRPDVSITADGALIVLGDVAQTSPYLRTSTLRRINVASISNTLRLKVVEVPATAIGYREAFAVRVGLRDANDAPASRLSNTLVYLSIGAGSGRLGGTISCAIPAGASECLVFGARYDKVETGVVLSANADGFAAAISTPMSFRRADTATAVVAVASPPYQAFSTIRVRAVVQGPPAADGHASAGMLSGPSSALPGAVANCTGPNVDGALLATECDLFLHSSAMPLTGNFVPYASENRYNASTAASLVLPITKAPSVLDVRADPYNTYVAGDRVRFRVAVLTPGGFNASPLLVGNSVHVSGGQCLGTVVVGNIATRYDGSYVICEIAGSTLGTTTLTFNFNGNDDLLAAAAVTLNFITRDGGVIRGLLPGTAAAACTTAPGMVCTTTDSAPAEWQCVGPNPSSGLIFMVPAPSTLSHYYVNMPFSFTNFGGGVYTYPNAFGAQTQPGLCKADVDGDGAVMAMTDGLLILRLMMGLTGDALTVAATHSCVPLTASQIAYRAYLTAYDLDGDGVVSASTDGLLLLRVLLGFRGEALVHGALGTAATRRTSSEILTYLQGTCGFALP